MNSEELQESYGKRFFGTMGADIRNSYERVKEFMVKFGHPVYDEPQVITDIEWEKMRIELIREEFCELLDALGYFTSAEEIREVEWYKEDDANVIDAADALGDMEYVVNGLALGMGIDLPRVVAEIHRSNMTKLGRDGKPVYRADGKIQKGEDYEPPNLEKVLFG